MLRTPPNEPLLFCQEMWMTVKFEEPTPEQQVALTDIWQSILNEN